jgi:hypothetical protein
MTNIWEKIKKYIKHPSLQINDLQAWIGIAALTGQFPNHLLKDLKRLAL